MRDEMKEPRTVLKIIGGPQHLRSNCTELPLLQFIQPLQCILDIVPSDQFLKKCFCSNLSVRVLSAEDERTRSPLLHLLRRDSKHAQHFRHNLSHHIRNRRSRWGFCIGLESNEEVFNLVEELDQRIAARGRVPRRL